MFKNISTEKTGLELARDAQLEALSNYQPEDPEYAQILKHITKISALIEAEAPEKLSKNTVWMVLGNVGVALVVVGYENKHVITTKLPSFLMKVLK